MSDELPQGTPDEVWDKAHEKYNNTNPIAKFLVDNFFRSINEIIHSASIEGKVLEVGCGPGISSKKIQEALPDVPFEVSEYDSRLITKLRAEGFDIPITHESVYELQRKEDEFDCVLLLEVLEHLNDYRKALEELFRVSKKYVIVSVPNEPLWRIMNMLRFKYIGALGNTPGHVNHWNRNEFIHLINEFGVCIKVLNPTPWTIILAEVQGV